MAGTTPNHLAGEKSPYLLQHALNPVDWYPWGEEALEKAKRENKLMIISIGYAACHWCHVMEHESFTDPGVADAMNRYFVAIKVDREERPDIDQVYMNACYVTTGRGGWPLNAIALPDQRPLFAGTYFPKKDWLNVLQFFSSRYAENPDEMLYQAGEVMNGLRGMIRIPVAESPLPVSKEYLDDLYGEWEPDFDRENGGNRGAPKFPMPSGLQCLLRYGHQNRNEEALSHVGLTLRKMATGGLYDHLGGGFSRYSVDSYWHVPHFEKMLYDNAQLVSLYSQAWQLSQKVLYRQVVDETIAFIERELTSPEGLFFASLDADSEGREGAFYAWHEEEIRKYLGPGTSVFLEYFSCLPKGNWEDGLNVLRKETDDQDFAAVHGLSADQLSAYIDVCRDQLFTVRSNRPRPATDDKILTCWNGLMISALTEAWQAFGRQDYLDRAIRTATVYRNLITERKGLLWRSYHKGPLAVPAFLDDYVLMTRAFLDLYQATFDWSWMEAAEMLIIRTVDHFLTPGATFFNLASSLESPLVQQTIELSDNVIPGSNSVMARNLQTAGLILQKPEWSAMAEGMITAMLSHVRRNPAFHAEWISLLMGFIHPLTEVQIVGSDFRKLRQSFTGRYLPGVIFSGSAAGTEHSAFANRYGEGETRICICRDKTCSAPMTTFAEALEHILQ
jgi:uncharacterized protein YyaL (SSP411 family)